MTHGHPLPGNAWASKGGCGAGDAVDLPSLPLQGFRRRRSWVKPEDVRLGEVLFEFHRIGRSVRVVAVDPRTNVEVMAVGDASAGTEALKRLAVQKLRYVIARRSNPT